MPDSDLRDAELVRRLRDGDPTAPAEFCEHYLRILLDDQRWVRADVRDLHLIEEAAHTALMDFVKAPERYDPARLPMQRYLGMAAHKDLLNLIEREQRHHRRRADLEAVDLSLRPWNDQQEAPALPREIDRAELEQLLREKLPDERDRQAAAMILEGVRQSEEYARLYGLMHLPIADRRNEVKRIKDRLDKVMKRLGTRIRGDE